MKLTREQVYQLIDGERAYQDSLPPTRTDGSRKTVSDYVMMLRTYVGRAMNAWADHAGIVPCLDVVRKIAGIAVRAMEEHGCPLRDGGKFFPPATRMAVQTAIDAERDYQNNGPMGWTHAHDEAHTVSDWLLFIDNRLRRAEDEIYHMNHDEAMHEVRVIAALAVTCMEHLGAPPRQ